MNAPQKKAIEEQYQRFEQAERDRHLAYLELTKDRLEKEARRGN